MVFEGAAGSEVKALNELRFQGLPRLHQGYQGATSQVPRAGDRVIQQGGLGRRLDRSGSTMPRDTKFRSAGFSCDLLPGFCL